MTDPQWESLLRVFDGELLDPSPIGFIVDSPWLPNWAGISILDYYSSERLWMDANLKAIRRFPVRDLSARVLVRVRHVYGAGRVWGKMRLSRERIPFRRKGN